MEKELGKVVGVDLAIEDHGILSLMVNIDFGGAHQGFGGYCLDSYSEEKKRRVGHACGTDFILRILNLFGVNRFKEIIGKPVYAIREKSEWGASIIGLETPPFDGKRVFMVEDWRKEWFPDFEK